MNGFVNTILSILLSWIRTLVNNVWSLLRSEDGSALMRFLSAHWLEMVIGLCAACLLVDGVVYFLRWRPDYVWATNWRRLRRKRSKRSRKPVRKEPRPPVQPEVQPQEAMYAAYAPLQQAAGYTPAAADAQLWQDDAAQAEPVWDEETPWESGEPMDWQAEEPVSFHVSQSEPLTYYRDVQAGFAPPVPPEQLYAPSASYQPSEPEPAAPVHPGLDEDAFRQNIGLQDEPAPKAPVIPAPAFRPFTVTQEPRTEPAQQGALQRFAQKARDFMAMDDDQKTIRDLHSVDVSKAFHEPVYPKSFDQFEE